jgi:hypothetical protein
MKKWPFKTGYLLKGIIFIEFDRKRIIYIFEVISTNYIGRYPSNYHSNLVVPIYLWKKGLCKAKHEMTAACQQRKVEQVYIKRKCRHSNTLETVICLTNCILFFCLVLYFTISSAKYVCQICTISDFWSLVDPFSEIQWQQRHSIMWPQNFSGCVKIETRQSSERLIIWGKKINEYITILNKFVWFSPVVFSC